MEYKAIQLEKSWHAMPIKDILENFSVSSNGLTQDEAELRLEKYGKNKLDRKENFHFFKLFLNQLKSPLVFILIIAGGVTLYFKEYTDTLVILIAVSINTAIGIFQEGKASQAFARLRDSQKKYATVLRNKQKQLILTENVVPGDILVLSAGDQVAADTRIIDSKGLEINEAVLTGEWLPSSKDVEKNMENTSLAEISNMAYMGTLVTNGWAKTVVVATAFNTEVGKIAHLIAKEKAPLTSFQKSVKNIARFLTAVILVSLVGIFTIGIFRDHSVSEMLFTSVAVAVAAIPEGLPVAVSVVLAIGMERILLKGGLVKKLNAAETLGSVDVILTDKTGTLTQAIMRVSNIITIDNFEDNKKDGRNQILEIAVMASDAFIENEEDSLKDWVVRGRPVEQAVLLAGMEAGLYHHKLLKERPRVDFLPFDAERRFAASIHREGKDKFQMFLSGAPEYILNLSQKIYKNGKASALTKQHQEILIDVLDKQTAQGARVIAVAYKKTDLKEFPREKDHAFEDVIFGGFIVFHDPLRPDAASSLRKARRAGIKTVMITGDHQKTAEKIAEEVGIFNDSHKIVLGEAVEKMSDKELKNTVVKTSVFARVLPHQKLRIIKAWQSLGKTVAMTGDGINDAPALRRADVGVALNSGTEVAKEASQIVLLNNSFSVIVSAIEEGRRILLNLRKIIVYLLSTSFSEIILIGASLFFGLPLPVLPAQILWTNLVGEGFMNFAFAFEPKEKGIMNAKPETFSAKKILSKDSKKLIALIGCFTSLFLVCFFLVFYVLLGRPIEYTRTIVFGVLSIDSIFFAFSLKHFKKPIWKLNIFNNIYLIVAIFISLTLLAGALFVPHVRMLLSLEKPDLTIVSMVILGGILNILAIEISKHFLMANKNNGK